MTLDIEGVLAGHRAIVSGDEDGWYVVCTCKHRERGDSTIPHVAAVLREQIAAWLTAEGKREMHERGGHWHTVTASDVHVARKLDALAAQVAPSRVPGEGS